MFGLFEDFNLPAECLHFVQRDNLKASVHICVRPVPSISRETINKRHHATFISSLITTEAKQQNCLTDEVMLQSSSCSFLLSIIFKEAFFFNAFLKTVPALLLFKAHPGFLS